VRLSADGTPRSASTIVSHARRDACPVSTGAPCVVVRPVGRVRRKHARSSSRKKPIRRVRSSHPSKRHREVIFVTFRLSCAAAGRAPPPARGSGTFPISPALGGARAGFVGGFSSHIRHMKTLAEIKREARSPTHNPTHCRTGPCGLCAVGCPRPTYAPRARATVRAGGARGRGRVRQGYGPAPALGHRVASHVRDLPVSSLAPRSSRSGLPPSAHH
jgi:hypothetical protein